MEIQGRYKLVSVIFRNRGPHIPVQKMWQIIWIFCLQGTFIVFWVASRVMYFMIVHLGIGEWSRRQPWRPGEAPKREGLALHEGEGEDPDISITNVLKPRSFVTFEFSSFSWCPSSTWFSFRMYKLLILESFFFSSFYWFGTFWRVCCIKSLICQLVYYLTCKEACVVLFKLSSREMDESQRLELGRFQIFSTAYTRFHWEMIACAVICLWCAWTTYITECREEPSYSNLLLLLPFSSGTSGIAVRGSNRMSCPTL